MTTDLFPALASALRARLEAIADRDHYSRDPAGHLERLKEASRRIAEIQQQLPPDIDPHLRHYLERCSYDKALAWLEERGLAT